MHPAALVLPCDLLQEASPNLPQYSEVVRAELARFALNYIAQPLSDWLREEEEEVRGRCVDE